MEIPKNMGYGEGGETVPKLGKILQNIVDNLNDLATKVETVEALEDEVNNLTARVGTLENNLNNLTSKVGTLENNLNDLTARVEALEGEGGGDG